MQAPELTHEDICGVVIDLIHTRKGRISELPVDRPWMFVTLPTREEAELVRDAFGGVGFIKPNYRGTYKWGSWGNDTMRVVDQLLTEGLRNPHKAAAEELLERFGNDGQPWGNELQRLAAERRRSAA